MKEERIDSIGFGNLKLIQQPEEFCYGVDAVILADFAAGCRPRTAIDLGTGTGVIPLILSAKTDAETVVGLEVQQASFERACRNVELNGLSGRLKMLHGDAADRAVTGRLLEAAGAEEGVDLVTCNPPYMVSGNALGSANSAKAIARQESTANLDDFIAAAAGLLKRRGHFYMVHRPSRLVDIICSLRSHRLEPKELRMVAPKPGTEPNIVLIHAIKEAGAELKVLTTLFVHEAGGEYTKEINDIYGR